MKLNVSTPRIVRSVLPEFSTIAPVSAESDAVIFSPTWKVPTTEVRFKTVAEVPSLYTSPVAPDVTPVTRTPPFACVARSVGDGVSLKVSFVNGRISNKYSL